MTKPTDRFIWSRLSKIDPGDRAGDRLKSACLESSNTNHLRSIKMLQEIRVLVQDGSSFRMQPDGPRAIASVGAACGGILECATSGSSGAPKIIRRSHRSWIASFEVNAGLFGLSPDDTYAVLGSLEHSLSLYGCLEAVYIGANLCMLAGVRADRQLKMLEKNCVTTLYATPTQLDNLVAVAGVGHLSTRMRQIFIGGGAFSPALAEKCRVIFPSANLSPFYGASETSFIAMAKAETPEGSVGTAYPGVDISIRAETGQVTSGIGEIWVRSPYLFARYAEPVASDTRHQDGFVTVGEYGFLDQRGNLFIKGRKSRMVTISDRNVFPDEIEQFLSTHYKAGSLAVVPVPDDKRGHRLAVVATDEAGRADIEDAIELCRKTLGVHRTPKYIFFAQSLPQLASGKLDYAQISSWIEDRL